MDTLIFPYKCFPIFLHASESVDLKLDPNRARNFWGYLVGTVDGVKIQITEVMLNQPDWISEDFSMQQAIVEDLLFSTDRKDYVLGGVRSHHKQGLVPSPEDLMNLSALQSVNPKAVFVVFDLVEFKSIAQLGFKAFRLVDPSKTDAGVVEIPVELAQLNENELSSILSKIYGGGPSHTTTSQSQGDEWLMKARDAIELENYADAEVFYKKVLQDAQQRGDVRQQLEIEMKLANLLLRDRKYGRVQRQTEKIRGKALEKSALRTVAQCFLAEGKALTYLGKRAEALQTFEKAAFQYQNLSDSLGLAQVEILMALIHIGGGNRNAALDLLFKAIGNFRNILDEIVRQEYLRAYLLEENAKNLIRTFPDKVTQEKYIKALNNLSEFRGYKVTLEEL